MFRRSLLALGFLAAVVMACSQENAAKPERICTPDAYVFCRCQDRQEGTKRCKEDGASFESCLPCDGSGAGIGSGGTDGLGSGHGTDAPRSPKSGGSGSKNPPKDGDDAGTGEEEQTGEDPPPSSSDAGTKKDSGTNSSGGNTNTGNTGSTDDSAPANAAHCKPLKNIAPRIELQKIADEQTPATGGKPVDGLYVQSWVVEFTGEDGESGPSKHYSRETLELDGNVGRYVFEDDDGTKAAGGFRLTANGGKVEVAYECPASEPKELQYDATSTTLIIYDPPYARVFVRQGAK